MLGTPEYFETGISAYWAKAAALGAGGAICGNACAFNCAFKNNAKRIR